MNNIDITHKFRKAEAAPEGEFGPIYTQFRGKPEEAIDHLLKTREGEAAGALHRPEIGDIDLVWGKSGKNGYGLSHIIERHGEGILKILPEIVEKGDISYHKDNASYVDINTPDHKAVIRLNWNNASKKWVLTVFEKDKPSPTDRTADVTSDLSSTTSPAPQGKDTSTIPQPEEDVKAPA